MGQLADKAHCVGDHHLQRIADRQQPGGGIQRIEQPVIGGDTRAGDSVEQRGLARVGVAHDGHHRDLIFHPPLPLGAAHPSHLLQLLLQLVDLPADVPPVRLQLRLTGALGADGRAAGAALPLQMRPHADEPRQQILVLRQLHLQAALLRLGPLGEDVQNEAAAVQHLHAAKLRQYTYLGGRQVVVEDDHGGVAVVHHAPDLLHLALADKAVGVGLLPALKDRPHRLAAGRLHQRAQLRQALLVGAVRAQHRGAQTHQHRVIPLVLLIFLDGLSFHRHSPVCICT